MEIDNFTSINLKQITEQQFKSHFNQYTRTNSKCFIDLKCMYYIFRTRQTCTELNQQYAVEMTTYYFNIILKRLNSILYGIKLVDIYLYRTAKLLQIGIPTGTRIIFSNNININEYDNYIKLGVTVRESLIKKILNEINSWKVDYR